MRRWIHAAWQWRGTTSAKGPKGGTSALIHDGTGGLRDALAAVWGEAPSDPRYRHNAARKDSVCPLHSWCQAVEGRVSIQLTISRRSAKSHWPSCLTN